MAAAINYSLQVHHTLANPTRRKVRHAHTVCVSSTTITSSWDFLLFYLFLRHLIGLLGQVILPTPKGVIAQKGTGPFLFHHARMLIVQGFECFVSFGFINFCIVLENGFEYGVAVTMKFARQMGWRGFLPTADLVAESHAGYGGLMVCHGKRNKQYMDVGLCLLLHKRIQPRLVAFWRSDEIDKREDWLLTTISVQLQHHSYAICSLFDEWALCFVIYITATGQHRLHVSSDLWCFASWCHDDRRGEGKEFSVADAIEN